MTKKLQQIKKLAYVTTCGPSGTGMVRSSVSVSKKKVLLTVSRVSRGVIVVRTRCTGTAQRHVVHVSVLSIVTIAVHSTYR